MALGKEEKDSDSSYDPAKDDGEFLGTSLDPKVVNLLNFIFDKTLMKKSMVDQDIDIHKMPLGELSKETVFRGY